MPRPRKKIAVAIDFWSSTGSTLQTGPDEAGVLIYMASKRARVQETRASPRERRAAGARALGGHSTGNWVYNC